MAGNDSEVLGILVRRVATSEELVNHSDTKKRGFADTFWRGKLLVEQNSKGQAVGFGLFSQPER